MKNYKKPSRNQIGEGQSNINQIDVLNPDGLSLVLKGRDWVNPMEPNYDNINKGKVKTIIQANKELTCKQKEEQAVIGKALNHLHTIFRC